MLDSKACQNLASKWWWGGGEVFFDIPICFACDMCQKPLAIKNDWLHYHYKYWLECRVLEELKMSLLGCGYRGFNFF